MEVYVTLVTSVIASFVTYLIARGKQNQSRDMFYEGKITALMEAQEKKIIALQSEVERLTKINLELLEKIIHLEGELGMHSEYFARSVDK